MTITPIQAAKYLCQESGWRYTHLELQKMIYIAHVVHLGEFDEILVSGHFEAWTYGVVHPELYNQLLEFGSRLIPESFSKFKNCSTPVEPSDEWYSLETVRITFPPRSGPHLIRFNHEKRRAWKKHYRKYENNIISIDSMKEEFKTYTRNGKRSDRL